MFMNFTITQSYYVIILYLLSIYILYQKPILQADSLVQCHLARAKSHVKQLGAHYHLYRWRVIQSNLRKLNHS